MKVGATADSGTKPSGAPPRLPVGPQRAALGSALLLIGCVGLVGEAAIQIIYTPGGLFWLVVLAAVALTGLMLGGARCRPPVWAIVISGLIAVRALALSPPLGNVVSDDRLLTGVLILVAVTAVPALLPLVRVAHTAQVAAVALTIAGAAYALVVLGGVPLIDVWALLQGAGQGLAEGRNPYELTGFASPPGQVDHCFTYFPVTALLTAPGVWLLGDARWAELAMLMVAGAVLVWHVRSRGGARLGLAVFVVVIPGTINVVQQAWTESLLIPALVATAILADRGRTGWAAVAFGVALATKQHMLLLAPLLLLLYRFRLRDLLIAAGTAVALILPWLLANSARFLECTVEFFLTTPAMPTSLSLWQHLPEPLRLPLLVLALLAGYLLAWRYCPRSGSGFLIGCATVLLTFGLFNKQTFLNQWWLMAALAVAGLAMAGRPRSAPARSGPAPADPAPADPVHSAAAEESPGVAKV